MTRHPRVPYDHATLPPNLWPMPMTCTVCSAVLAAPAPSCPVCGSPLAVPSGAGAAVPVRALGAAAQALLALTAVAAIVLTMANALRHGPDAFTLPEPVSMAFEAGPVLTVLVFLEWFSRIRHNAGLWGPQRRARGWAYGAWFTPGVNLWFPYQIAADAVTPRQVGEVDSRVTLGLVRAWWASWILALPASVRLHYGAHGIPADFTRGPALGVGFGRLALGFGLGDTVAGGALAALSALLAMRMVSRITAAQCSRIEPGALRFSLIHVVPAPPEQEQAPPADRSDAAGAAEPTESQPTGAEPPAPAG